MNTIRVLVGAAFVLIGLPLAGATLDATWNFPAEVPVTAAAVTAAGDTINLTLNCVPTANELTVIRNTGPAFIDGEFGNLAQGQMVALSFNSVSYSFVANYFGGSGNDLVLVRAGSRVLASGANTFGQIGDDTKTQRMSPVAVSTAGGVLSGKIVTAAAAGGNHSLALCSDGTLAAWGLNTDGELGNNSTLPSKVPVAVNVASGLSALAGKTVIAVAAGELHSVALCSDGSVAAWGSNYNGQIGNGSTVDSLVPVAVSAAAGSALNGKTVTAISAGQAHTLALCSDGSVVSWGFNASGELGNNSTTDSPLPVAVDVSGPLAGRMVIAVAAGGGHSLALCSDGTLVAWGANAYGQLGNNTSITSLLPVIVNSAAGVSALAGKTVTSISAGQYHSLALCSDGSVAAWGLNANGQLGDSSTTQRLVPTAVHAASGSALFGQAVVRVQAGQLHSVAQCADGTVAVWGWNGSGQLGDASTAQRSIPVSMNGSALSGGERYVAAFTSSTAGHTLVCAASASAAVPIIAVEQPVGTGLSHASTLDFGTWIVGNPVPLTFTIRNKGTAPLTGLTITKSGTHSTDYVLTTNPSAPLISSGATTFTVLFTPAAVGTRTATVQIASNDPTRASFTINLTGTGAATGGVSAVYNAPTDIPVSAASYTATGNTIGFTLNCVPSANELMVVNNTGLDFIQGTFSNLAHGQEVTLTFNGITYQLVANYYGGTGNDLVLVWKGTRVVAWGHNNLGAIGNNTTTNSTVPLYTSTNGVLAGKTVISVASGGTHSLALCSDGTLAAWGDNQFGELGDNSTTQRNVPVAVNTASGSALNGKTVIAISASDFHSLALCSDGTVAAWGKNDNGQLGDNTTTQRLIPVAVNTAPGSALNGKSVVSIATGYSHSLGLCSDGTVACWGFNGVNGNALPFAINSAPGSALNGKTVISVAAGAWCSLALCSDGTVAGWGGNASGQLGDGTVIARTLPVAVNMAEGSALYGKTVNSVAMGFYFSTALCSDGTVVAWGSNAQSNLGNNTNPTVNALIPVAVNAGTGTALLGKSVASISSGGSGTLTLCSDGTAAVWGGLGSISGNTQPGAVVTTSLAPQERLTEVSTGSNHYLALASWPGSPLTSTLSASNITPTSATLNASVNANGNSPAVTFEFGLTTAYGTTLTAAPASVTGTSPTAVSATVSGLLPGVVYHYRVKADSIVGRT